MRWRHAATRLLLLSLLTGCPSEFGKDGRINKASHQDTMDLYSKRCTDDEYKKYCANGRQNTPECRHHCG